MNDKSIFEEVGEVYQSCKNTDNNIERICIILLDIMVDLKHIKKGLKYLKDGTKDNKHN